MLSSNTRSEMLGRHVWLILFRWNTLHPSHALAHTNSQTWTFLMEELGFFLKSYRDDIPYVPRFLESFERHNVDDLPLIAVVPEGDVEMFGFLAARDYQVISEKEFSPHLVTHGIAGNSPGYTNHQIIRMAFWELGLFRNTVNVDSEMIFIRDFSRSDFLASDETPYTFMSEDFELRTDPIYRQTHFLRRFEQMRAIKDALSSEDDRMSTMHGGAVYNAIAWESLRDTFMRPRNYTYADLLRISPIPPTWYTFWVQEQEPIRLLPQAPWWFVVHNADQFLYQILAKEVDVHALPENFIGLVVNSGFSREQELRDLSMPVAEALAFHRPLGDLLRALIS